MGNEQQEAKIVPTTMDVVYGMELVDVYVQVVLVNVVVNDPCILDTIDHRVVFQIFLIYQVNALAFLEHMDLR